MVSIIMPVYKAEKFLKDSVGSVISQSYKDWELILVDDGSPDKSGQLCDLYTETDKRIKVIHQSNSGVSAARNAGISLATGSLIAFLDSDDRFEPDFLADLINAMERTGANCAGCGYYDFWPDGRKEIRSSPLPPGFYKNEEVFNGIIRPLLHDRVEGQNLLNGFIWRYVYRTDIVKKIKFSGAYLEDEIFLIEYFSLSPSLVTVDKPLCGYYQNPESVTHRYLENYVDTFLLSLRNKEKLVEKYHITGITGWRTHTCWAGLLIAVGNIFARGQKCRFLAKTP